MRSTFNDGGYTMASARMPDYLFDLVAHHLPPEQPVGTLGGRLVIGHRTLIRILWFVLATGNRWDDVQPELGCSGGTTHRRLRPWKEAGIRTGCTPICCDCSAGPGSWSTRP
jgi:transposase